MERRYLKEGLQVQDKKGLQLQKSRKPSFSDLAAIVEIVSPGFPNPSPRLRQFCFPKVKETVDGLGGGLGNLHLDRLRRIYAPLGNCRCNFTKNHSAVPQSCCESLPAASGTGSSAPFGFVAKAPSAKRST